MRLYPLFLLLAATTVLVPGPGVVMTVSNALRFGYRGSVGGILGIAFGAIVLATISATGAGLILARSPLMFRALGYAGAAYLGYLGVRLWRSSASFGPDPGATPTRLGHGFTEGLALQMMNPKPILFFLLVIPQFTDARGHFPAQVAVLALTYSALVVAVHSIYALAANRARALMSSERAARAGNRIGGATFVILAALIAAAQR